MSLPDGRLVTRDGRTVRLPLQVKYALAGGWYLAEPRGADATGNALVAVNRDGTARTLVRTGVDNLLVDPATGRLAWTTGGSTLTVTAARVSGGHLVDRHTTVVPGAA